MDITKLEKRIVDKIFVDENGCWIWTACKTRGGYGMVRDGKKSVLAHRYVWSKLVGALVRSVHLDHFKMNPGGGGKCSRSCVNPGCLEAVTPRENTQRGRSGEYNAKKKECPSGHEYNEKNTYVYTRKSGRVERQCRVCHKLRERAKKERYLRLARQ